MTRFHQARSLDVPPETLIDLGGVKCRGVLESYARQQVFQFGKYMQTAIVPTDGGNAIRMVTGQIDQGVFIMSEHSKKVRVFKTVDTALKVCRRLGLPHVLVYL